MGAKKELRKISILLQPLQKAEICDVYQFINAIIKISINHKKPPVYSLNFQAINKRYS